MTDPPEGGAPLIRVPWSLVLALLVVALVVREMTRARVNEASISASIDASGRWVTLRRVHPTFVDAIERSRRNPPIRVERFQPWGRRVNHQRGGSAGGRRMSTRGGGLEAKVGGWRVPAYP